MTSGGQRIGGEQSQESGRTFLALDPTSGAELPGEFFEASDGEIDRAVRTAAEAGRAFRECAPIVRAEFLERVADEIEALGEGLLERAHQETALPLPRLTMERGRTCGQLRAFAKDLRNGHRFEPLHDPGDPDRTPIPKPDLVRKLLPVGPVAVFGASNFPLAFSVAGGDTASALAAGCPVIVKAHPAHPGTSAMVASAIEAAITACQLPAGIFSLLQGQEHATGARLVDHPQLCAVAFTGSFAGGKALFQRAQTRRVPIPVFAEMGSVNPIFVLPGALETRPETIAEGLAQSVLLGVGQFCTNPGLVAWIEGPGEDRFLATLADQLGGADAGTMLHQGIREGYEAALARQNEVVGVTSLAEGKKGSSPCSATAALSRVDAITFLSERVLSEEVFGPSTLAVIAKNADELIEVASQLPGQLTGNLHGESTDVTLREALRPVLEERCGRITWNQFPTGVEVSPAMQHGGPWPATSDARFTSVGLAAIERFLRPVCYQGWNE